jgi:hypothetical protein
MEEIEAREFREIGVEADHPAEVFEGAGGDPGGDPRAWG